jgi:hypothetical protein
MARKSNAGRPTAYKPEYCQSVIEHMKNGMSIASFAATVGVSRETIWKWGKAYPEFRNACEVAKEASQMWWEKLAIAVATGQHKTMADAHGVVRFKDANHGMIMFLMSRRFTDYHDPKSRMREEYDDTEENVDDEDEVNEKLKKEMERYNARARRKEKADRKA